MDKAIAKNSERGKHPNSLRAIEEHQYQKGVSGNLGGRPKKYFKFTKSLSKVKEQVIKEMQEVDILEDISFKDYKEVELGTNKELVIDKIWELARGGNEKMIFLLVELGLLDWVMPKFLQKEDWWT